MRTFAFAICVLVALTVASAAVATYRPNERDITVVKAPHLLDVRSVKVSKRGGNAFTFGFTTLGYPRFRVGYLRRDADSTVGFKFRVGILGLIEYAGDINQPFNRSNVIRRLSLMGRGRQFTEIATGTETLDGITYKTATTSLTFPLYTPDPVFTLSVRAAPKFLQLNKNVTLGPDRVKFDIEIDNFPFKGPIGTYLGVVVNIQSKAKRTARAASATDTDGSTAEGQVDVEGGGRWSYAKGAMKSQTAAQGWVNVKASPILPDTEDYTDAGSDDDDKDAQESSNIQVFLFDDPSHPNKVVWDPTVGLDEDQFSDDSAAFAAAAPASTLLLAAMAVLAAVFAARS